MKFVILIFLFLVVSSIAGQRPIVFFPLDNSQAKDYINGLNGTVKGGAYACEDRFGNKCGAIYFNGIDGFIDVPNSPIFNTINTAFSVSFWFKIDAGDNNYLTAVCKGGSSTETFVNPHFRLQYFQFASNSTISINSEFTEYDIDYKSHILSNGNWNFYSVTYDGSSVKSYLNTIKISEIPYRGFLVSNDDPLYIARDIPGSDEFFKGALDDIKIYDRAISELEISNLFIEKNNQHLLPDFELSIPQNIEVFADANSCSKSVIFQSPTLVVNCNSKVELNQVAGLKSGSQFPVGENIISFKAVSETGYNKTISFKIEVKDITSPQVVSALDTNILLVNSIDSIKVNYKTPVFKDNCSNVKLKLIAGKKPGKYFYPGVNLITYEASDNAGNKTIVTLKVIVKKQTVGNIKPQLANNINVLKRGKYDDVVLVNELGKCGATYALKKRDSNDYIFNNPSSNFYKVGVTKVIIKNKKSEFKDTFNLTVIDKEPPRVLCLNDTIIYSNTNVGYVEFDIKWPKATDNCELDTLYESNSILGIHRFATGLTELEYTATDISGNSVTCKRKIEVVSLDPKYKSDLQTGNFTFLPDTLKFVSKFVTIRIYDNKQEDNDTVSIYFNGDEIIKQIEIKNKSNGTIVRSIELSEIKDNELTFKAWNLGGIPPNTLKIELFEGDISNMPDALKKQKPKFVKIISSTPEEGSGLFLKVKR